VYLLSLKPGILVLDFSDQGMRDLAIRMKLTSMRRRLVGIDRMLTFDANQGRVVGVDDKRRPFQESVIHD